MIKLEKEEFENLKKLVDLKDMMYSRIFEMIGRTENIAAGIYDMQKNIEKKYDVVLSNGKHRLSMTDGTIDEIVETPAEAKDNIIDIKDLKKNE